MENKDENQTKIPVELNETEKNIVTKISASFSKILSLEKKMADRKGEEK